MNTKSSPDFTQVDKKVFVDIPNAVPEVQIPLDRVGVTNRPITLTLIDPFSGSPATLPCRITVFSSLQSHQRGLHMSRIEEAFDELRSTPLLPSDFVSILAEIICKTQQQHRSSITLEADYEHRVAKNPSGKSSVELLTFLAKAEREGTSTTLSTGLVVPFINACPCTQRWGMREFYTTLRGKGYEPDEAEEITRCAPLQAHTNRGSARVTLSGDGITHRALYEMLDRAVPVIRELLKGPDEHSVVSATHRSGQFCEDNIRAILREIVASFGDKLSAETLVEVDVEVDESVHFHNLSARYSGYLGELSKLIHRA